MKNMFTMAWMLMAAVLLTGCFESEDSKAIREALANEVELGSEESGYSVTDVEVLNETTEVKRGYDIREIGFTAVAKPKGDAVVYANTFEKTYFYEDPAELEPSKFAGRYLIATNGVKTEVEVMIDDKTWNRSLKSKAALQKEYEQVFQVGSDEAKAFLQNLMNDKDAWSKAFDKIEGEYNSLRAELNALDNWSGTPEEQELKNLVYKAEGKMREQNQALKKQIEAAMNKELTPHSQENKARLNASRKQHGPYSSEYRSFRNDENARYKKIEKEIIDRYSKQYADEELSTTPEVDAAKAKLAAYQEQKAEKIAQLRKQADEKSDARSDLRRKISQAEYLLGDLMKS